MKVVAADDQREMIGIIESLQILILQETLIPIVLLPAVIIAPGKVAEAGRAMEHSVRV